MDVYLLTVGDMDHAHARDEEKTRGAAEDVVASIGTPDWEGMIRPGLKTVCPGCLAEMIRVLATMVGEARKGERDE